MSDRGAETIGELLREVKDTRDLIASSEAERLRKIEAKADRGELDRLSQDMAKKTLQLQTAVEALSRKVNRPGAGGSGEFSADADQAAARSLVELKYRLRIPKHDPQHPFAPSLDDVSEAETAIKAMRHLLRTTSIDTLDHVERKALTSFQLGSSGFLLPPEWSSQILSCLEDKTNLTGLVNNIPISGASLKMFADSSDFDEALWACDTDCWSATRVKDLTEGLSERELKPEPLRYIVCCSRDILEDASVNIETWLFNKVSRAFQNTVSRAIMTGDGVGKPQGILHPSSGIIVCDTSTNTPPGQFTWQDLIMLKFQVAIQWHAGGSYICNQQTFALILTMSDAMGRPIMLPTPVAPGQYTINGSPVQIATQMPDVLPGSTPICFGTGSRPILW
jgi:HK97 family phage major capsid protein